MWTFGECVGSDYLDDAEQALHVYRGPFLDGPVIGPEPFVQWAAIQRARLEGKLDRVVLNATAGRSEQAPGRRELALLEDLVRVDPLCLEAMLRVMEIDAANGRTADALRKYQRYARRLKLEYDDFPSPELHDAFEVLKSTPARHAKFAPPRRRPTDAQTDPWRRTSIDAPVVAVLPFRYLGSDRKGGALAAAMGEDITMMLSGCRWFNVLSRNATHSFPLDMPFIPKDFVNRTGADYLIYGAVVDRGEDWTVTVELADAETGLIGWAKRYNTSRDEIMLSSSELCPLIVAALDPAIAESEQSIFRKPSLSATGSVAAYDHLVIGYRHYYAGEWAQALSAFRRATHEDNTYAHAYAMMAITIYYVAQVERNDDWRDQMKQAERLARRALKIDPSEAKACNILGQVLDWQGCHDEAVGYLDTAASRNPSFAGASTARAYHAVMTGGFDKAKSLMQTAIRLRVGDSGLGLCLPAKALADLHLGNYEESLQTAHWAMRLTPGFWLVCQVLAAALLAAGDTDAASKVTMAMKQRYGRLSREEFAGWFPYDNRGIGSPVADTLQHFGWR